MRTILFSFIIAATYCTLASCGGKNDKSAGASTDTSSTAVQHTGTKEANADSTLAPVKEVIEKDLAAWSQSFKGFHIDSFRMSQKTEFGQTDNDEPASMSSFYELYKPSLSFSPDSNYFIDLYSSGIMLEKKGKKIVANSDVDQAITLCNLKTKEWKSIAFFGPSAGIEEAIWISPSAFILAGIIFNDDGEQMPFMMLGDVNSKSFRWFESGIIRPKSVEYKASGMAKLKIDEWE